MKFFVHLALTILPLLSAEQLHDSSVDGETQTVALSSEPNSRTFSEVNKRALSQLEKADVSGITPRRAPYDSRMLQEAYYWEQLGSDIDGESSGDNSGYSVSLSGDGYTIAIGAINNDDAGPNSGHVRVYEFNTGAGTWSQKGQDIDGLSIGAQSGFAVSMSNDGNTVAIGAPFDDVNVLDDGSIRIFEWTGSAWAQKGQTLFGPIAEDVNGIALSLNSDGTIVLCGISRHDAYGQGSGLARVYEWTGSAWTQKGQDMFGDSEDDRFGRRLSINGPGDIIAISALRDGNNGFYSGSVTVFEWGGSSWVQRGDQLNGVEIGDQFGSDVALTADGNTMVVGHIGNNGNGNDSGRATVFEWSGSAWVQKGQFLLGESAEDQFGISVAISDDGNIVAVGAHFNDGANGANSGHARVYEWSGSSWEQKGPDIDGDFADDESGFTVSLSSDGGIIAVGAVQNDGNGSNSGHAKIYRSIHAPTTAPTAVPTAAPTAAIIIVESNHDYWSNQAEKWTIAVPGWTCYNLNMDPLSWTPERQDFVRIFGTRNEQGVPVTRQYPTYLKKRLYKKRLFKFVDINLKVDELEIQWYTNEKHSAYGFKLYITECADGVEGVTVL